MLGADRLLAIIPARGGSKGIRRKNLQDLGGHPLVAWPILVAAAVSRVDRIIVSTEDSEIAAAARTYGAEVFDRSADLASDTARVFEVLLDLRERLGAEGEQARYVALLEPTAAFRSPAMIDDCLDLLARGHDSVTTFRACRTNPHRAWTLDGPAPAPFLPDGNPW